MSKTDANKGVILLNKPFLGGWLDEKGNIGHEIIDFLKTDDGHYFVYNNPRGVCPDDIWIGNPKEKLGKYIGKYLVLTSEKKGNGFEIQYVIELKGKLHSLHCSKNDFEKQQEEVKEIIREKNIKYNGKFLYEIYDDKDDSLYVTFEGERIYKAEKPIAFECKKYNFQRNKGYIRDNEELHDDYFELEKLIKKSIANGDLKPFKLNFVTKEQIGKLDVKKTFLDLIRLDTNEQVFTNILHSILEYKDLLKRFCNRFRKNKKFNEIETFEVFRETKVVDGRMDVCAKSINQKVIIENKVFSGLNGIKPADSVTQLSTYYEWGLKETTVEPLCFIIAPDSRLGEINKEIECCDRKMKDKYISIGYSEIASFLCEEYKNNHISNDYTYYSLMPQIIYAFKNLSHTKDSLYASKFLAATN